MKTSKHPSKHPYRLLLILNFSILLIIALVVVYLLYKSTHVNTEMVRAIIDEKIAAGATFAQSPEHIKEALDILQTNVDNFQSNVSMILTVAGILIGLFGLAVPIFNYAFEKNGLKELTSQISDTKILIAVQKKEIVTARKQLAAQQQEFDEKLEEQQTLLTQQKDEIDKLAKNILEQANAIMKNAAGEKETIPPLGDNPKDKARALFLQSLSVEDSSQAELDLLNKAIEFDPNHIYYNNRGCVYHTRKNYDKALADYNKAIELDPTYTDAYNNRGITYRKQEKPEQAIADYTKAIELNPTYTDAYNNRGYAYIKTKNFEKALPDINKAFELNPNNAVYHNTRAEYYLETGDFEKALADIETAISLDPKTKEHQDLKTKIDAAIKKQKQKKTTTKSKTQTNDN